MYLCNKLQGRTQVSVPLQAHASLFSHPVALRPNAGHGLLILEVSGSHTTTHHSRQDSSGRVISSSQRPLPDNTQHSQQTNIHAPGGIRTHDLIRRAAADLLLKPRGHWDRQAPASRGQKLTSYTQWCIFLNNKNISLCCTQ